MNKSSGILKNMLLGASVGTPIGVSALLARNALDKPTVLTFPEAAAEMPLISEAGPAKPQVTPHVRDELTTSSLLVPEGISKGTWVKSLRERFSGNGKAKKPEKAKKEKKSAVTDKLGELAQHYFSHKKKSKNTEKKADLMMSHLLGGGAGLFGGYKGLEALLDYRRKQKLEDLIAARKQEINNLLLQEQRAAVKQSSVKKKAVSYDIPIGQVGRQIRDLYTGMAGNPLAQLLFAGVGGSGLLYGAAKAYQRASAGSPERALKREIKRTLAKRLGERQVKGIGDGKGATLSGRGPMIVKLKTERLGTTPLKPGNIALTNPAAGRDVLGDF